MPVGLDGPPPFSAPGPVTVLRGLGVGFEVRLPAGLGETTIGRAAEAGIGIQLPFRSISRRHATARRLRNALELRDLESKNGLGSLRRHGTWVDYVPCGELVICAGDLFAVGDVPLMALDDQMYGLLQPAAEYCGPTAHGIIDLMIDAFGPRRSLLALRASGPNNLMEIARRLHTRSVRATFPFTCLDQSLTTPDRIEAFCIAAACGTVFVDTTRVTPSLATLASLASPRFHLKTILSAPALDDVHRICGFERSVWPLCIWPPDYTIEEIGFPRVGWHLGMTLSAPSPWRARNRLP